ncbi:hypothetical protein ETC02_16600, partial [Geobacillus sp. DSP4a]|nr:hypothetical protein [Geobacillus sp. DSP4a]
IRGVRVRSETRKNECIALINHIYTEIPSFGIRFRRLGGLRFFVLNGVFRIDATKSFNISLAEKWLIHF